MNNRQKAKRFKKLYERMLAKSTMNVKIYTQQLKTLEAKHIASGQMIRSYPEIQEEILRNKLIEPLIENLRQCVSIEYDAPRDIYTYALRVWIAEAEDPNAWWRTSRSLAQRFDEPIGMFDPYAGPKWKV